MKCWRRAADRDFDCIDVAKLSYRQLPQLLLQIDGNHDSKKFLVWVEDDGADTDEMEGVD